MCSTVRYHYVTLAIFSKFIGVTEAYVIIVGTRTVSVAQV